MILVHIYLAIGLAFAVLVMWGIQTDRINDETRQKLNRVKAETGVTQFAVVLFFVMFLFWPLVLIERASNK